MSLVYVFVQKARNKILSSVIRPVDLRTQMVAYPSDFNTLLRSLCKTY